MFPGCQTLTNIYDNVITIASAVVIVIIIIIIIIIMLLLLYVHASKCIPNPPSNSPFSIYAWH